MSLDYDSAQEVRPKRKAFFVKKLPDLTLRTAAYTTK